MWYVRNDKVHKYVRRDKVNGHSHWYLEDHPQGCAYPSEYRAAEAANEYLRDNGGEITVAYEV
jgi:hypothetical protein